jgi:hypothetical protein
MWYDSLRRVGFDYERRRKAVSEGGPYRATKRWALGAAMSLMVVFLVIVGTYRQPALPKAPPPDEQAQHPHGKVKAPPPEGTLDQATISAATLGVSFMTFIVTSIGTITSAVIAWRGERRKAKSDELGFAEANLKQELLKLQIEQARAKQATP